MILYGNEAREHLKSGIDILANAVKVTLGPCGNNVVINRDGRLPLVTKDGVTVAKHVVDEKYKIGINLIKSVAERMGEMVGDNTSSATILAQRIVELIYPSLEKDNTLKPIYIKKGIDLAVSELVEFINKYTMPVEDRIQDIAMISSNGDKEIADTVIKVINKTGKNGLISLKPSESNTYIKYSNGLKIDTFYMSPNFVTNPVKMEVEYEKCHIYIYDNKLEKLSPILPALELCRKQDIPIILMVKDIEQEVLNTLVYNKIDGRLKCCVVRIPGHDTYRNENILDIKAVIGDTNLVDRVLITSQAMYIENSCNNQKSKQDRIDMLKHKLTLEDQNVEDITNRIANISNSFATIYVSGSSDVEIQEKIDRYDDSLCAVKSAIEEGIVPGGGNLFYKLSTFAYLETEDKSVLLGYNSMYKALQVIRDQILSNGSVSEYDQEDKYLIYTEGSFKWVNDILEYGVIDSAKGARLTIENAASIAGAIITTNCVII